MTPNKRIFLNVMATYGRSLFSLVCGLFTSRWILMSLGQIDYGLYGLVGGIIGFVTFFNSLLSLAVGRFYAYEVGKASVTSNEVLGVRECQAWFSTAVFLHTAVPLLLVLIGWPLGEYAVSHWLTIPVNRLSDCIWVFRFSCLSCLVGMMSVPFNAMYTAKQYIAELTVYSVAATSIRVIVLYYMVVHPGSWFLSFGFVMMLLAIVPNLIISVRACVVFPECRLILEEMLNGSRIRQLGNYAGWELFGMGAWTVRTNGIPILINEFLGPAYNSSMTIATAISGHANSLSASLSGAFAPAITNASGAGEQDRMRSYAFRVCKIGTLLMLAFAIPLFLEMESIIRLWLQTPPPGVEILSRYMLVTLVLERVANGHHLAVCANGRIAKYQMITSLGIILFVPVAWCTLSAHLGLHAVGISLVLSFALHSFLRAWCSHAIVGMSLRMWWNKVLLPVVLIVGLALVAGSFPVYFLPQTIFRVLITCGVSMVSLGMATWLLGLNRFEKTYVRSRLVACVCTAHRLINSNAKLSAA